MNRFPHIVAVLVALSAAACDNATHPMNPVASLSIAPSGPTVQVGDTLRLTATAENAQGQPLAGEPVTWASLDPSIATVSSRGLVTGVSVGSAHITASAGGTTSSIRVTVVARGGAGSLMTFNVNAAEGCSSPVYRGARVMAVGQHAIVVADTANPSSGLSSTFYQSIANTFDQLTWPTDTDNFGEPTDIDGNGHVIILFTRAVNELTPKGAEYLVGGFFFSRDLFPTKATGDLEGCAGSNQAEMFYMLAPDPNGTINGHTRTAGFVDSSSVATLAHEFQHLINASRRLYVNHAGDFEVVWPDEGLAHVAEELNFYAASGLGPGRNIDLSTLRSSQTVLDAVNEFQLNNLDRYSTYLEAPESNSPIAMNDSLATRGGTWSFLRYAADRKGGDQSQTWRALVNSTTTGLDNLRTVLGVDPLTWIHDWAVMNYTDDDVSGIDAVFTEPSWNFRSVLPAIHENTYPLQTHALQDGAATTVEVQAGSAAYLRFGVGAGQRAEIRTSWGGYSASGSCAAAGPVQTLAVGQAYQADLQAATDLCFDGGSTGEEFVLIPFYDSGKGGSSASVTITGTGIVAIRGTTAADLLAPLRLPSSSFQAGRDGDGGWEHSLRWRERTELTPLIRRPRRSTEPRLATGATTPPVQLVVVRTR